MVIKRWCEGRQWIKEQMVLQIFILVVLFSCVVTTAATVKPLAQQSDCQRKCGDIIVPYPFGLDEAKCSRDSNFSLTCDRGLSPPKLLLDSFPILNISLENATALIEVNISFSCYDTNGMESKFSQNATMGNRPFVFSTRNKFTAIGCDTIASIGDGNLDRFTTGCISVCSSNNIRRHRDPYNFSEELISCGGIGCCQTSVPKELKTLYITLASFSNHSSQLVTNPCSFGFLSYPTWYKDVSNFTLADGADKHISSPVVLDWAIRGFTCEEANGSGDKNEYICGPHTNCIDTPNSAGYLCSCEEGYNGNPYTKTGCQDIDECNDVQKYPCNGKCKNNSGNYTCACPFGRQGDGKLGCGLSTGSKTVIGIGAVLLFANFLLFLYWLHKKKIHQLNHRKNGGFLLDQLSIKSFKEEQIVKATNNFDSKNLLGEGGNGWVYRGLTEDRIEIAVKKSKVVDQDQIEQFLNEAEIVSKINHKNVVKLLGLCVDSKVPMLVYDYVPNGTLYQHLHGKNSRLLDSWRTCLRIAAETARALDYMHSLAYPPIIHRDIKTSNILLDETYTAKVADFGASILIPLDRTMAPTQGQGTMGYLDPEYLQTGELTTMSDVYGFGVVLMELLSKQKPITREQSGEMIGLVKIFTSAAENNQFEEVVKVAGVSEHENEQVYLFANLAIRCVAMPSKKRPTMTEVTDVLNGMSKEYKNFTFEGNSDEVVNLLDEKEVMSASMDFEQ